MPTYCFTLPDGRSVERFYLLADLDAIEEADGVYRIPEGLARINVEAQQAATPSARGWPMLSDGAGCHPCQVREFNEHLKSRGVVGAEYQPNGQLKMDNRAGRRKALKALNMHDRNGGFGDG